MGCEAAPGAACCRGALTLQGYFLWWTVTNPECEAALSSAFIMGLLIKWKVNILGTTISIQSFNLEKGQTFLTKSNSMARLCVIGILQYSYQHLEIACLPTGIAVTIVGLFLKQGRKLNNYRITYSTCSLVRSTNIDKADMTAIFRHICSFIICLHKKKKSSVAKVIELHNNLNTVGVDFANASELGA